MIKIFTKEDWIPPFADKAVFVIAPAIIMVTVLMSFAVVPFAPGIIVADLNIGLAVLAGDVFARRLQRGAGGLVFRQQVLAARRTARRGADAQLRSLHGPVAHGRRPARRLVRPVGHRRGAASTLVRGSAVLGFVLFLIAGVAETRRLPFDLPEAESELVAGFHSEYSGMKFGMFFVGEYLGVILISSLITVLFFGGWLGPVLPPIVWFLIKMFAFICFFILLRASLPRPRFDQLMSWGWKVMLPLALLNLLVTGAVVLAWR